MSQTCNNINKTGPNKILKNMKPVFNTWMAIFWGKNVAMQEVHHMFFFNMCFTMHFYDSTIFIPTNAQLDFIYNKIGLHVSAYQAIIRAPITMNTENTASQNKQKP
jgi:hypothetical protein